MSLVGEWDIIGTTRENSSIYAAWLDLAYMSQLTGKTEAELTEELTEMCIRDSYST